MYNYDYYYPYDGFFDNSTVSDFAGIFAGLLVIFAFLLFVSLAYVVVFYIFNAIGLYNIAKNRGMKNPYLAFIPIANSYYLGKISDDIDRTMNKKSSNAVLILAFEISCLVLSIVSTVTSAVSSLAGMYGFLGVALLLYMLALAAAIAYSVFVYISLYKIYKEYVPEKAVLFEVLSVLFDIHAFFLFAIRNKKSGYQKWVEQQAAAQAAQQPEPEHIEAPAFSAEQAPVEQTNDQQSGEQTEQTDE